jgi:predicted NBD/HSP70 family sugar kinase
VASASRSSRAGSTALRARSERLVLQTLQQHGYAHARGFRDESFAGLPLAKLAEAAGLSRPSVYNVQRTYRKLLLEPLRLRPDLGYAVGVDFGPHHARVAIADIHGRLFERGDEFERYFTLRQAPELYLDWAASKIDELLRAAGVEPHEVMGVGISQVAPINCSTGHPHPSGLVNKAWRDVNVGDQLARRLVPLRPEWDGVRAGPSDNDSNLIALAEHAFGSADDLDDVLYVNWSNHVGFGLILRGAPYRGSRGYAGWLGHRLIEEERGNRKQKKNETTCHRCGKVGCLEMRVGAARLAEELGAAGEKDLVRAADYVLERVNVNEASYNPDARSRVADAARLLGGSVASIVDTLDPAAIILGGSFGARIHEDTALLTAFREGLEERMMGFAQDVEIRAPKLETSAVRGACLRVLSERLVEWAQHKAAATESQSAQDRDTATSGISA